jgi:hypothetical protein
MNKNLQKYLKQKYIFPAVVVVLIIIVVIVFSVGSRQEASTSKNNASQQQSVKSVTYDTCDSGGGYASPNVAVRGYVYATLDSDTNLACKYSAVKIVNNTFNNDKKLLKQYNIDMKNITFVQSNSTTKVAFFSSKNKKNKLYANVKAIDNFYRIIPGLSKK